MSWLTSIGWETFLAIVAVLATATVITQLALPSGSIGQVVGALAQLLPIWALIPFLLTAVLVLVAGVMLGIYFSGLTLLSLGIRIPRPSAAARTTTRTPCSTSAAATVPGTGP